jgi:hypothetical protein
MPKTKKDVDMLAEMNITRKNHVAKLAKAKGWNRAQFIREARYQTLVSDRTLERAYDGEIDLSLITVEQLAKLFNVTKDEILESIF